MHGILKHFAVWLQAHKINEEDVVLIVVPRNCETHSRLHEALRADIFSGISFDAVNCANNGFNAKMHGVWFCITNGPEDLFDRPVVKPVTPDDDIPF